MGISQSRRPKQKLAFCPPLGLGGIFSLPVSQLLRTRHLIPVNAEILIEPSVGLLLVQVVGRPAPHAHRLAVLLGGRRRRAGNAVRVNTVVGGGAAVARVEHVVIGGRPLLLARSSRDVVEGRYRFGGGDGSFGIDARRKIALGHASRT